MRSLHLTIMIFCQVLLASFVLYSQIAAGSPVVQVAPVSPIKQSPSPVESKQVQVASQQHQPRPAASADSAPAPQSAQEAPRESAKVNLGSISRHTVPKQEAKVASVVDRKEAPVEHEPQPANKLEALKSVALFKVGKEDAAASKHTPAAIGEVDDQVAPSEKQVVAAHQLPVPIPVQKQAAVVEPVLLKKLEQPNLGAVASIRDQVSVLQRLNSVVSGATEATKLGEPPVVNGGLGPLHLLAATLCSYQPERVATDETLNQLYLRRASVRKSLFDFMSLKFTNLEKLSSRLNAGLEVVPPKPSDPSQPSVVPSHGWPLVGKCTAHDLKLMAEAAWCECAEEPTCASKTTTTTEPPKVTALKQQRARSLSEQPAAAIVSKLLHVNDAKEAPAVIESSLASLNLTQQQLASIQAQTSSTRECRRNALRLTKALFNHLAEDQKSVSESWPKLYASLSEDECARKRVVDIVSALSGFRSESTSIRRDNAEFAFAMDDLRSKVLENEVNVPLTFDKEFIEVGQFLQQSVKLMMANIDPERARLTSMRYRSYMPGPVSADDQCIELHQRLLAKNYPSDCNPTQFGQLPDVLRMAASSLELWSIENELSKHSQKTVAQNYQDLVPACALEAKKRAVNECIANLVSS